MSESDLHRSIEALKSLLQPLRQGEFSEKLYKITVYVESVAKSWEQFQAALAGLESKKGSDPEKHRQEVQAKTKGFEASTNNSLRFARLNLDAVLVAALEVLVWRPRLASKTDEHKKAVALQKTFDRLEDPAKAMLEHFQSSSDPLNKYLVAGTWGHEYLRKRKVDLEDYDRELCEMLGCQETAAGRIVRSYASLNRSIDELQKILYSMS
jgi:hypothetical protein